MLKRPLFIAYKTIVAKEVLRFMRIWVQTILPPMVVSTLYLLIFGYVIGSRIGQMDGEQYLSYIVPGVVLMSAIMHAYSNTVSSFFLVKFNHSIEEILVSPMPNWLIMLGFITGGIVRGVIVGFAVFAIAWILVDFALPDMGLFIITLLLTTTLFSVAGFINAIFAKSFDDITIVPNFILMPLTYLGGMFYDIKILPEFWQTLSLFNPIFYMIDSFKASFFDHSIVSISLSFSVLALMIGLLFMLGLYLMQRHITDA